ncbi:O-antigen ligase family protein [Pasteurellaceae bacterium LIM206]|nr:O-antigen ligase family protein [Pasteurellaceae bacterium LIM206]
MIKHKTALAVNLLVGCFFLTVLTIKSGYAISPILLILFGIGYAIRGFSEKRLWHIDHEQKKLVFSCVFYALLFILSFFIYDGKPKEFELPLRVLLLLPLLPLFNRYKLKFNVIISFIPVGAIIAALIALFDRFYLHSPMAFGPRIMHIQGGDISMSLGMFCLVLGVASITDKNRKNSTALYFIGAFCGVLGSLLSTARGGWIGVPFIVAFILWVYRTSISKRFFTIGTTVIAIALAVAVTIPQTQILTRINQATDEITAYIENGNGSTSVGARFDMWKSAWMMIREKPLFGRGANHIIEKRQEQYQQGLISQYAAQFNHSHNQFIDDTVKRGVIGLLALLAVFLVPLRYFWQYLQSENNELKVVATLGVVHVISVLFYGFSQAFFAHNSGVFFYFFLIMVFYGLIHSLKTAK